MDQTTALSVKVILGPIKKSRFGDIAALFFDDLLWAATALKAARSARA